MSRDHAVAVVAAAAVSGNANANDAGANADGRLGLGVVARRHPDVASIPMMTSEVAVDAVPVNYYYRIAACRGWPPRSNACGYRSQFRLAVV